MKTSNLAPRVRGARALVALLPNGHSVWLKLQSAHASVRDIDRITETIDHEIWRRSQALNDNETSVGRLARDFRLDLSRLNRARRREDRQLRDRIAAGDAKMDRRIADALLPAMRQVMSFRNKQKAKLRQRERRELWNQLVLVSALLLTAAYGQRGSLFSEHNLVIALSLGVWLFGDEVADALAGKPATKKGSIKGLDVWSYTAPFANLLTGWWLLGGRQHERLITGTARDFKALEDIPGIFYATVDLSAYIAPEHRRAFQAFQNVPAVATIRSVVFEDEAVKPPLVSLLRAAVLRELNNHLLIIVRGPSRRTRLKKLEVAWSVDTRKPSTDHRSRMG